MGFSYTVVAHVCEGLGDCIPACPVECIHWAGEQTNEKGTRFVYIDGSECINCHACLAACPIEDAILREWQPTAQVGTDLAQMYRKFRPTWRTEPVLASAELLRQERTREAAVQLAVALVAAGCTDLRLLHHLRSDPPADVVWVADLLITPNGSDAS